MSVYVDEAIWPFGRMVMCHLLADTAEELHTMAARVGVARKWFQANARIPHYDLCKSKRELAIKFGAVPVTRKQCVYLMKRHRGEIGVTMDDPLL